MEHLGINERNKMEENWGLNQTNLDFSINISINISIPLYNGHYTRYNGCVGICSREVFLNSHTYPGALKLSVSPITPPGYTPTLNGQLTVEVEPNTSPDVSTDVFVRYPEGLHFIRLLIANQLSSKVNLFWRSNISDGIISVPGRPQNGNRMLVFLAKVSSFAYTIHRLL